MIREDNHVPSLRRVLSLLSLTSLSISHGTGIEGQGSGRVSLWSVCSPFMFKSMYLDFGIKRLILMTTKNWLQNSYLPSKKKKAYANPLYPSLSVFVIIFCRALKRFVQNTEERSNCASNPSGRNCFYAAPQLLNFRSEWGCGRQPG